MHRCVGLPCRVFAPNNVSCDSEPLNMDTLFCGQTRSEGKVSESESDSEAWILLLLEGISPCLDLEPYVCFGGNYNDSILPAVRESLRKMVAFPACYVHHQCVGGRQPRQRRPARHRLWLRMDEVCHCFEKRWSGMFLHTHIKKKKNRTFRESKNCKP